MAEDTGPQQKIQFLFDRYEEKRYLFEEYTKTIAFLLENLLRRNNSQFQTVQHRAKELSSFKEKLFKKKDFQDKQLLEMSDLAGCRVIFYFEEDLYQFVQVLYDEFSIIDDQEKMTPNEYNARHIVVKLNEKRTSLSEYSKFKELLCEIQLTTVLYHAWSEIQHDVIYKPNQKSLNFDKPTFDYLDNYFKEIMEKYLKEASRGFSFIYYQFNKIQKGQVIINPATIDDVAKSQSNNEIYNFLRVLNEYVGKYCHNLPKDYNLIQALETTLDSAEKNPIVDRTTVFGELKGITYTDIGDVVLDILGKYCDVSENLRLAIRLSKNALLRKKCEDVISQMVSYRIGVIESYGFSVQKSFLNFVNDMKPGYLLENLDFILHTIRPIASFECEDWSMTDTDTVTFRHGCLPPTAALAELRKQYFQLTKNLFQLVTTNANRRKVFDAMFCLADVPHSDLSIETVDLLSTDIANIIDFLIASIDNLSNVNKEDVQKLVYRIERLPFKNQFTNLTILNDRIAHDPFFEKFRIFYGDDLHFFPNFDFEKAESFRLSKIDEYVNVIDCGNFDDWRPLFEELLSSHKEFGVYLAD